MNLSLLKSFNSTREIRVGIDTVIDIDSISRLIDSLPEIHNALKDILEWEDNATNKKCDDLILRIESSVFMVTIFSLKWILDRVDPLVKKLQNSSSNHLESTQDLEDLAEIISSRFENAFRDIFEEARQMATKIGCPIRMNRLEIIEGKKLEEIYREKIFAPACKVFADDIRKR